MPGRSELLAIVGATLIDGTGAAPLPGSVLLIQGRRIAASGDASLEIPREARKIEAAGKFVIPGLMDANVHLVSDVFPRTLVRFEGRYDELAIEAAQVALKSGVTTVFDSWGPREYLIKARDAIASGRSVGARVYLAGNIVGLGGPCSADFYPHLRDALFESYSTRVDALWQEDVGPELLWMSPREVRERIRRYVQRDIDFLKYAVTGHSLQTQQYIAFSSRVQHVIVEEARRAGLPVQSHQTSVEGMHMAIEAGVDLMQHCEITGPELIPEETLALMAERRISGAFLAQKDEALEWHRRQGPPGPYEKQLEIGDRNERALVSAGAAIVLSTDGGVFSADTTSSPLWKRYVPPQNLLTFGEGHFNWLEAAEQKGMKPMDALQAATRNIARAYHVDRDLGTLEKGKLADLIVLDRNPLAQASHYRSIHAVLKDGAIVDRDALPDPRWLSAPIEAGHSDPS